MSTASVVPETAGATGERAVQTVRAVHLRPLLADSARRLRWSDGFSHARALAFQLALTVVPGSIVIVALAGRLRWASLSRSIVDVADSIAPGPTTDVFRDAFDQGASIAWPALVLAALAFVICGATAFGQVERAANRIYGVEADRPTFRKYGLATLLMLSAGVLVIVGFATLGLGEAWFHHAPGALRLAWAVGRIPLAIVLGVVAAALIFKLCPRRRQPTLSWLTVGGLLAIVGTIVASLLLDLYLAASSSFGTTYGPLAGFIGVLLWLNLVSVALLFGLAFAAQLEAARAGRLEPRDHDKVEQTDPPSQPPTPTGEPERSEGVVRRGQASVGAQMRNEPGLLRNVSWRSRPFTPPSSS